MLTARDLMTESPHVVDVTATLQTAIEKLHALDIRHLPVVDSDGALVGRVSDRDGRAYLAPYFSGVKIDASGATVRTSDVNAVDVEADAAEIVDLMLDHKIGAVPVVDGDNPLVGIVSYIDLLRALSFEDD